MDADQWKGSKSEKNPYSSNEPTTRLVGSEDSGREVEGGMTGDLSSEQCIQLNSMQRLEQKRIASARQDSDAFLARITGSAGFRSSNDSEDLFTSAASMNSARSSEKAALPNNNMIASEHSFGMGRNLERMEVEVKEEVDLDDSLFQRTESFLSEYVTVETENLEMDVDASKNYKHMVAYPTSMSRSPLNERPTFPARTFNFELDPFQKQAIKCIDNNRTVLVSAHTSAGKTVVAIYAIGHCLRRNKKAIYTSPTKALSNQKYRDLADQFGDVGILTGDVTLNPDAPCLVMTTEIFRSMVFREAQLLNDVGYVIFDEIHYMTDKDRGVVWEEAIVSMPPQIEQVFLSATIPNAQEFAEWIAIVRGYPCHVVSSDHRPVSLQHFVFPHGLQQMYEVIGVKGDFKEQNLRSALHDLEAKKRRLLGTKKRPIDDSISDGHDIASLIRTIKVRKLMPCIVFSFSRKECEASALSIQNMDFNTEDEKRRIDDIYNSGVMLLLENERNLPQISQVLPLLKRGIGIHHSGLVPIIKEITELLFCESLIKVLFATETFATGVNMPAHTVVFSSARKFDGTAERWITSGEYIQMSGRAGRRGIDRIGTVIMMIDGNIGVNEAKRILTGKCDPLISQFKLSPGTVLNLMKLAGTTPEYMIQRSFYQYQNMAKQCALQKKLDELKQSVDVEAMKRRPDKLGEYFQMEVEISTYKEKLTNMMNKPRYIAPFLHAGRLLHIVANDNDFGWGALVDYSRKNSEDDARKVVYLLMMLLPVSRFCNSRNAAHLKPPISEDDTVWQIVPVALKCVTEICAHRMKLPASLKSYDSRMAAGKLLQDIVKGRFAGKPVLLHPIKDMQIADESVKTISSKLDELEKKRAEHPMRLRRDFETLQSICEEKCKELREISQIEEELEVICSPPLLKELSRTKALLQNLNYCNEKDEVLEKGLVACELSTSEIILTEMMFGETFTNLSPEQLAAFLSCFVSEENTSDQKKLPDHLSICVKELQSCALKFAKFCNMKGIDLNEHDYVNSFKTGMMESVYKWATEGNLGEILKKSDVFEGSIIRCFRRIDDILREMGNASKLMENRKKDLEEKIVQARYKIRKGVVFAGSLYT